MQRVPSSLKPPSRRRLGLRGKEKKWTGAIYFVAKWIAARYTERCLPLDAIGAGINVAARG